MEGSAEMKSESDVEPGLSLKREIIIATIIMMGSVY